MVEKCLLHRCQLFGTLVGLLIQLQSTNAVINETFNGYLFTIPDYPDNNQKTQADANRWCQDHKNTLLEIYNSQLQGIVAQFINTKRETIYLGYRQIFTNGMRTSAWWQWVNGQSYVQVGFGIANQPTADYSFVYLITNKTGVFHIADNLPTNKRSYICEVSANTCTGGFKHGDKCYTSSTDQLSWFDARSRCLNTGGDLASFDFVNDSQSLYSLNGSWINQSTQYWIGLRREVWQWQGSGSEIIYTNWQDGHPQPSPQYQHASNCLCLVSPQRDWEECDCNQNYQFICLMDFNDGSTSTTSLTTNGPSKATSMGSLPTPSSTSSSSSSSSSSFSSSSSSSSTTPSNLDFSSTPISQLFSTYGPDLYNSIDTTVSRSCNCDLQCSELGVGLGIVIPALLIILILVVLLIRQTRRSRKFEFSLAEIKKETTKFTPIYESLQNRSAQSQEAYNSLAYQELSDVGYSGTGNSES